MAKKKRFVADKVRNRRTDQNKKTNPFEVKVNRQKHVVLGQKIAKHDRGLPGVSRSKANKRRKETLLHEYQQRFKSNQLVDRRIGENDPNVTVEEKMLKRYAVERERNTGGSKFNLNEDEELTHFGQSLAEIEKFDDPEISDDEEDSGKIGGDMVAQEHFGGFLTRKNPESDDQRPWKEKMEEMIAKSKKAKYDRQSEKEKSVELTEKLDEEWSNISQLLGGLMVKPPKEERKPAIDDYDIAVRELKYDLKGKASDRLKSEEELAKEEKEKLEKLEADRVRRMKGILTDKERSKDKHRSADSLDDGFSLDTVGPERIKVRFQDGQLIRDDEDDDEDDDEEDESDDSDSDKDDNVDSELEDLAVDDAKDEEDVVSDDDDDDDDDGDDDGSDKDDNGDMEDSDDSLEDNDSDDDIDDLENDSFTKVKSILKKKPESERTKKLKNELKQAAKNELPYIFEAPDSYDTLLDLLYGRSDSDQLTIIERIRKCHHVSLSEANKAKMETLLRLLIQHFGSLAVQEPPSLDLLNKLTTHIYQLTQKYPRVSSETLQRILQTQQAEFIQLRERRRQVVITLDTLLYMKLVSVLFPTSDYSHPVTTPAMLFMGNLLNQTPVTSERDVASGLFLCNACLEYVAQSRRFVPEALNFLHGVLFMASNKTENKVERVYGAFKPVGKSVNLLKILEKHKSMSLVPMKLSDVFGTDVERSELETPEFRLSLIHCAVSLIKEFSTLYEDLPSHLEVFSPLQYMLSKLPTQLYPPQLQEAVEELVQHLDRRQLRKTSLVFNKAKPKPLPMFEPQIEDSWDGQKKRGGSNKAVNEKQRLLHKVKKEMKGAMREIRKDTQFLARHQQSEARERDAERKRKVKALYGNLSNQEGEVKALKRKKKK